MSRKRKTFAFFSQRVHGERGGQSTAEFRNAASGEFVKANWIGASIRGYPGFLKDGTVVRPPNYKTYVRVGEVGPGCLQIPERPVSLGLQDPPQYPASNP
jgi:hypothetical protein